jgi:hypothetical protein
MVRTALHPDRNHQLQSRALRFVEAEAPCRALHQELVVGSIVLDANTVFAQALQERLEHLTVSAQHGVPGGRIVQQLRQPAGRILREQRFDIDFETQSARERQQRLDASPRRAGHETAGRFSDEESAECRGLYLAGYVQGPFLVRWTPLVTVPGARVPDQPHVFGAALHRAD